MALDLLAELEKIADDWMALFQHLTWEALAQNIYRREPRPAGETDMVPLSSGQLVEASHSLEWVAERGGDIRLEIWVYQNADLLEPSARRTKIFMKVY